MHVHLKGIRMHTRVVQKQSPGGVVWTSSSLRFHEIHRKVPVSDAFFHKIAQFSANSLKRGTDVGVFLCF